MDRFILIQILINFLLDFQDFKDKLIDDDNNWIDGGESLVLPKAQLNELNELQLQVNALLHVLKEEGLYDGEC